MDSPKEEIINKSLYNIGDLLYSKKDKIIGLIKEIDYDIKPIKYKIDFLPAIKNYSIMANIWSSEWWNENTIHARLLTGFWILQKKKI